MHYIHPLDSMACDVLESLCPCNEKPISQIEKLTHSVGLQMVKQACFDRQSVPRIAVAIELLLVYRMGAYGEQSDHSECRTAGMPLSCPLLCQGEANNPLATIISTAWRLPFECAFSPVHFPFRFSAHSQVHSCWPERRSFLFSVRLFTSRGKFWKTWR